jgi:hypothetical protein
MERNEIAIRCSVLLGGVIGFYKNVNRSKIKKTNRCVRNSNSSHFEVLLSGLLFSCMRPNVMRSESFFSVEALTASAALVFEIPFRGNKFPAAYISVFPEVIPIVEHRPALRTCHLCHD